MLLLRKNYGFIFLMLCAFGATSTWAKSGKSVKVEVITAETYPLIEELFLAGSVVSPKVAKLSVQVSGQVSELLADLGQRVTAGSEIVRLDSELERLALAESRAATEKAAQELEDVKRRLADARRLLKRNGISANQVELLKTEVLTDTAELKRMQTQQSLAKARLERYRVYAPFNGVVSEKLTEVGEWLNPGTPVVTLTAVNDLTIDFQLPQAFRDRLNEETEVEISFSGDSQKKYQAEIVWLMPVANPQSRTLHLRTKLTTSPESSATEKVSSLVVPGMSASAVLRLTSGEKGVAVPRDALIRHPDGRVTVWVVNKEDSKLTVSERIVQTGMKFTGLISITGVEAGEQIVVKGNESLRNGMSVKPQSAQVSEKK